MTMSYAEGMNPDCSQCDNTACFIYRYCSEKWKERLASHKTSLDVKHKQPFIFEGASVTGIFFLYDGKAIVYKGNLESESQVLRLAKSGDIVGHRGMSPEHRYPISAMSLGNSKLCFIPLDEFIKSLKANPELGYHLMLYYAEELNKAEDRTFHYMKVPVKARVADVLLSLINTFGYLPDKKNQLAVTFPRKIIANMAGTTYESLLRLLAEFTRKKIISYEGKDIKILKQSELESIRKEGL